MVSIVEQLRRRVRTAGRRYWTSRELRDGIEASSSASASARDTLVKEGLLVRVRPGLFWHAGPPDHGRRRHPQRRTAGQAARALFGERDVLGPSGWSATHALGLSTQLPPTELIAVSRRPPTAVPGVRFKDRSRRTLRVRQALTETEVALFETLEAWTENIEVSDSEAIDRLIELLRSGNVRLRALVGATSTEPPRVRERFRRLLQLAGEPALAGRVERAASADTRTQALAVFHEADE